MHWVREVSVPEAEQVERPESPEKNCVALRCVRGQLDVTCGDERAVLVVVGYCLSGWLAGEKEI